MHGRRAVISISAIECSLKMLRYSLSYQRLAHAHEPTCKGSAVWKNQVGDYTAKE